MFSKGGEEGSESLPVPVPWRARAAWSSAAWAGSEADKLVRGPVSPARCWGPDPGSRMGLLWKRGL